MAIRALAFDTGGTILDWHSGISRAFAAAGGRRGLRADWSAVTNEYRRQSLKAMVGQLHPAFDFDDVHRRTLDEVIGDFGLAAFSAEDRDAIISCQMIGIYKTRPEAYLTAARWLALDPSEIMMVACHNFDLNAARSCGYKSAFVRRPAEWGAESPPDPVPDPAHDFAVDGFAELADRLGA